ncbi:hypothetical protein J5N97_011454 [Dioscorea zingiberensis]|uniref:Uncharacterized protein n=1 Tax=Dioscorea zingiberensis TaxID=325984 RepID=A0A9D5D288_9LILI|nr:hypothetical protein J5N97_011454 [Dioscorea zingiberensis]
MAASPSPVEIGTRGTVASLVSKEIEYFQRLDIIHQERSQKPKTVIRDMVSTNGAVTRNRKKKVASSGGFLPSFCSVVKISNGAIRADRVAGNSYKNLRTEGKRMTHS